jgi:hypothetical protein
VYFEAARCRDLGPPKIRQRRGTAPCRLRRCADSPAGNLAKIPAYRLRNATVNRCMGEESMTSLVVGAGVRIDDSRH